MFGSPVFRALRSNLFLIFILSSMFCGSRVRCVTCVVFVTVASWVARVMSAVSFSTAFEGECVCYSRDWIRLRSKDV